MFYVFAYTTDGTEDTTPVRVDMELSAGVIHQVDVLFQKDAAQEIYVQIFHGGQQLWPSNRGAAMKGDATIVSFREFYELKGAVNNLHAIVSLKGGSTVTKEIIVQIGLLPKQIIQPLSFDELLNAAQGV